MKVMKVNPLAPLAALTVLATVGAVVFSARPADIAPAGRDWREASALINWKVGSKWTYKVSIPDSPDVTSTIEAVRTIRNDEGTIMEFLNTTTTPGGNEVKNYQYQLLGREGIFLVYNATMESDRPGYGDSALGPNIPATLDPNHKWNWDEPFRGQTMAGNAPGAAPPSPSSCFGHVVDRTTMVATPMGGKAATVIAVEEKREGWSATTTSWYVEGIGMVRQETKTPDGGLMRTLELTNFTPGA